MPKHPAAARKDDPQAQAAVVLPFPGRATDPAATAIAKPRTVTPSRPLPEAPAPGERPTFLTPVLREWLRAALIVSVAVHAAVFIAFELRFEDDLERAAGIAAALSSEGAVAIPIEIVVEAALPPAPMPSNATTADATEPQPDPPIARIEELMPPPPEPAPVVLPARADAVLLALPEETNALPLPVESAKAPESPPAVTPQKQPLPPVREPIRAERKVEPETKQAVRPSASAAASPSRAAAAESTGSIGAGGAADTGGRAAISSYQAQVLAHLSRYRLYPPEARDRGTIGIARVQFALARDGRVMSVALIGGSGDRTLDEAALDMVRRASPFPLFPAGLAQTRMDFAAPIRFDLR